MKNIEKQRLHEKAKSLLRRAAKLLDDAFEDHLKAQQEEHEQNATKKAA